MPSLEALCRSGRRPRLVVTQPDRPAGRGRETRRPAVAERAVSMGLPLAQPPSVRDPGFLGRLRAIDPDWAVVVAFGQIFPSELLDLPQRGCLNVHASLLPAHRGAAPVQAALAAGDEVTGVSIMQMDEGLDTGPVVLQRTLDVGGDETAPELAARLAELGAEALVEAMEGLEAGALEAWPQEEARASYARRLTREDGAVDWSLPAQLLVNRVRAFVPWPGSFFGWEGERVKVLGAAVAEAAGGEPGAVVDVDGDALRVACGAGTVIALERVQRPGRKPVSGADFARGARLAAGDRLA